MALPPPRDPDWSQPVKPPATLTSLLTLHFPGLFRCGCGEKFKIRPLADIGEREEAWAAHFAEVARATGWVDAETYATSGRVSTMYQSRVKRLALVLMDAKGLIREIDSVLYNRIDEALVSAGFKEE